MPVYESYRKYTEEILYPGNPDYETCRRNNPSGDAPDTYPAEIHVAHHVEDVVFALDRANELKKKDIGVRSGGHTLSNGALFTGILIDTTHLNRNLQYDSGTHDISFGLRCGFRNWLKSCAKSIVSTLMATVPLSQLMASISVLGRV